MWASMRERRQSRRNSQNWIALSAEIDAAVGAAGDRQRRDLAAQIFRELLPTLPPGALTADGREALASARTRPEGADAAAFRSLADRIETALGDRVPDKYVGVVDALHSWADHLYDGNPESVAEMAVDHLLRTGGGPTAGLGHVDPLAPVVQHKAQQLFALLGHR